jgi:hypothetical protein
MCIAIGLLAAEGLLYVLAGKIAEGVRGPLSLTLAVLFSIAVLVGLMLSAPRR